MFSRRVASLRRGALARQTEIAPPSAALNQHCASSAVDSQRPSVWRHWTSEHWSLKGAACYLTGTGRVRTGQRGPAETHGPTSPAPWSWRRLPVSAPWHLPHSRSFEAGAVRVEPAAACSDLGLKASRSQKELPPNYAVNEKSTKVSLRVALGCDHLLCEVGDPALPPLLLLSDLLPQSFSLATQPLEFQTPLQTSPSASPSLEIPLFCLDLGLGAT